jgi:hypothetical protein
MARGCGRTSLVRERGGDAAQSRLHDRAGKDAAGDESHDASSPGNEPEVANDSGDTGRDRTNPTEPRLRFIGTETSRRGGRLTVTARLAGWREEFVGSDTQVDSAHARLRSGARAILDAANQACAPRGRFELEDAARIRALGRDYVLLTVVAHAPRLGRRPSRWRAHMPSKAKRKGPQLWPR